MSKYSLQEKVWFLRAYQSTDMDLDCEDLQEHERLEKMMLGVDDLGDLVGEISDEMIQYTLDANILSQPGRFIADVYDYLHFFSNVEEIQEWINDHIGFNGVRLLNIYDLEVADPAKRKCSLSIDRISLRPSDGD